MNTTAINTTTTQNNYNTTNNINAKNTQNNTNTANTTANDKKDKDTIEIRNKRWTINDAKDPKALNSMMVESDRQVNAFRDMIRKLLQNQASTAQNVNGKVMIQIDEATQKRAQQEISEDGYLGVKKTSERILGFAKAFAGDNPEKLQVMKDAFLRGFESARVAWGGKDGKLPEISGKTYDAVMAGFDKMMGTGSTTSAAE
ncbi:MAG: hypothetical protein FWD01_00895 [Defluviitaleaceae bacterium]|nr:hypothetical protein [Defluviitaleaceae bacterium]